jgi:hypothetical protein
MHHYFKTLFYYIIHTVSTSLHQFERMFRSISMFHNVPCHINLSGCSTALQNSNTIPECPCISLSGCSTPKSTVQTCLHQFEQMFHSISMFYHVPCHINWSGCSATLLNSNIIPECLCISLSGCSAPKSTLPYYAYMI